jgi:hypothetical protein
LLSSLLHFIQHVPEAEPELDSELEVLTKSESMPDVRRRFATLPFQYYSEVWNPIAVPAEADPIVGDLADDLADIYLDVKRGLLHLEHDHPFDAAFHWAFMFRVHWGRHATSALRALHCYLVDPDRPEPGTAGSE